LPSPEAHSAITIAVTSIVTSNSVHSTSGGRFGMGRPRQKAIELLIPLEVAALIEAASRRAPTGIRNKALIAVLYFAGLRVSEALALCPRDIDLEAGSITVRRGKGGKQRTVGLNPAAVAYLERWVDHRQRRGINGKAPIFCTLQGTPLSPRYVRQALNRYAEKAEIEKRVHPHGLRHSHAAYLAQNGVPVNLIQQQLGHTSLATTGDYLNSIAPVEAVRAVSGLDWGFGY